jgi:hypothetical protein
MIVFNNSGIDQSNIHYLSNLKIVIYNIGNLYLITYNLDATNTVK